MANKSSTRGFDDLNRHTPTTISGNGKKYTTLEVMGRGSFGVVYKARCDNDGSIVAIKKVMQDQRFKNRELQILQTLKHINIVYLYDSFYYQERDKVYLHLIMEHLPETIHAATKNYTRARQKMPLVLVKLYIYQLARSLSYLHAMGVCHRDIKPQNLLVDEAHGVLKLCDFGSAKHLVPGEASVAYICSRYYRAPELIMKATKYSTAIDMWSTGCVLGEILIGEPLFPGKNTFSQLIEIVKILGTPTDEQIDMMNQDNDGEIKFSTPRAPKPWESVLGPRSSPEAVDLLSKLLCYEPQKRIGPLETCAHPFFDEIRSSETKLPDGSDLPPLFNFTQQELESMPVVTRLTLVPAEHRGPFSSSLFE